MTDVALAVIGCGPMGADLARQARDLSGVRVTAVADIDPENARVLAEELGADAYTDGERLLARDDVDAVLIATPGWTHAEWTVKAFEAGKHVFVEKPMALHSADCARMIEAGRAAGKLLMVGQVLRYYHVFAFTGNLAREGRLGELSAVRITRTSFGWGGWMRPWRAKEELCGGVLFEISVHELDFMLHILGEADTVHAVANHKVIREVDYPDTVMVNLHFASGAVGQLAAGLADRIGRYCGEIIGTEGAVHFDGRRGEILVKLGEGETETLTFDELDLEHPVKREVREFVEAIRGEHPVTIPGEEGLRVVKVAEAARQSAKEGRIISL